MDELKKALTERLRGISPEKVVFIGVGNRLRGDDGIGPALIDLLDGRVPHAIDANNAPENVTSSVRRLKPSAIVFFDAASFKGAPPGSVRIVEAGDMEKLEASAHNFSLDVVMEYLKEYTGADVFLIGVQPGSIEDKEGLTPEIESALGRIAETILETIKK